MCIGSAKSAHPPPPAQIVEKKAPKLVASDTETVEARRRRGKKTLVTDTGVNTSGAGSGLNIPV